MEESKVKFKVAYLFTYLLTTKVIIHKSRSGVSLVEQDTIEYVSWPIQNSKPLVCVRAHAHTCGCGDFCANRCRKVFRNVHRGACVNHF